MPAGSFGLPIQSAPVYHGIVGSPTAFATGTSDISTFGIYTKDHDITGYGQGSLYVFQVQTGGTIGTTTIMEVTWTNGETSGRFDVGTDAGYAAGDKIYMEDGLSVSFGAGTLVALETSVLYCYSARRVPPNYVRIESDANPADVELIAGARASRDKLFPTDSGDLRRFARRIGQNPRLVVNYQDGDNKRALAAIESGRQEVTIGENYDQHTVFLLRGGGIPPMIGRIPSFSRATDYTGCGQDPVSGQIVPVADHEPRIFPGVQWESDGETVQNDRDHIPLRYNHVGRSIGVCQEAVTNVMTNSEGTSDTNTGWAVGSGSPTISYEEGAHSPVARDANFPEGFGGGATRLQFNSVGDSCETDEAVVSSSTTYRVSFYVKGSGTVVFYVKGGNGSATTVRGSVTISGTYDDTGGWTRASATITSGSSDNRMKIEAEAVTYNYAVYYVAGVQIEANDQDQVTAYIPTTSATAQRKIEGFQIHDPVPHTGTLSFLWFDNGNDHSSTYPLVECTSGTRFGLRFDASTGSEKLEFHTSSSGALTGSFPVANTRVWQWWHVAATWSKGATNTINRELFINGASVASDSSSNFNYGWGPLKVFPSVGSTELARDFRIQEIRMDRRVLSDQEILDQYERFSADKWTHMVRNYAGRHFFVSGISERWKSLPSPGQLLADVTLAESSVHEPSLMGEP